MGAQVYPGLSLRPNTAIAQAPRVVVWAGLCFFSSLLLALGGCSAPTTDAVTDARGGSDGVLTDDTGEDSRGADAADVPLQVAWSAVGVFPVDEFGASALVEVPFASGLRFLAFRITAPDGQLAGDECFRLEPVETASGAVWVQEPSQQQSMSPVCTACTQKVFSGHGYGLFVFPNDGNPLAGPDTIRFRVQMRDCRYGVIATGSLHPDLPASVRVEVSSEGSLSESPSMPTLGVRVAVFPSAEVDPATWSEAIATMTGLFAAAGIQVEMEGPSTVASPLEKLVFGAGVTDQLDAAFAEAMVVLSAGLSDTRFLPVMLVPCLERYDPVTQGNEPVAGTSPRIPGGSPVAGAASGVFVATGSCLGAGGLSEPHIWTTGPQLGLLLAHEMGHYLGLYHSDTAQSNHRVPAGQNSIMNSRVLLVDPAAASFSPAQQDVLLRHPDVTFP